MNWIVVGDRAYNLDNVRSISFDASVQPHQSYRRTIRIYWLVPRLEYADYNELHDDEADEFEELFHIKVNAQR